MTDQELIDGILRQHRSAFQYLVSHYQQMVVKTAFYFIGNMEDAEDLSQEIFIDILHAAKNFRGASSLQTWIYRITVNRSLNFVKKRQRRGIFLRLESLFNPGVRQDPQSCPEPEAASITLEEKERHELLHQAINRLPQNQRIAFVLTKFEDQSYRQVADIMKVTLPAVESLVHRAKTNLQRYLMNDFSEYQTR